MKRSIRLHPSKVASLLMIVAAMFALGQTPALAAAQGPDRTVKIGEYRDPLSKNLVEISMPEGTTRDIRSASPKAMRSQSKAYYNEMCGGFSAKNFFFKEYPFESVAFATTLGLIASTKVSEDPAAMYHWYKQSVVDPVAHISFMGFMLANRGMMSLLKAGGLVFDPCNPNPKIVKGKVTFGPPTRFQNLFAPLAGPVGMAAGVFVSGEIHQLIADKDLQLCATSLFKKIPSGEKARVDEACEKAHENWAVGKKLNQYAPQIMSMTVTSLIQGYVINQGLQRLAQTKVIRRGTEKVIPIVLRSLGLGRAVGSLASGPIVKFGLTIANLVVFMGLDAVISPYFVKPWETRIQGGEIAEAIDNLETELARAEKSGWNWQPKAKPKYCEHQPSPEEMAMSMTATGIPYVTPIGCDEEQAPPAKLIKKLGEKHSMWRQFILQDSYAAYTNWTDYVRKFTSLYSGSYEFYKTVVDEIRYQRFDERSAARPGLLYHSAPLNGLKAGSIQEARVTLQYARTRIKEMIAERESGQVTSLPTELQYLREILVGFDALLSTAPPAEFRMAIRSIVAAGETPSNDDVLRLETRIRTEKYAEALRLLNRLVKGPGLLYPDGKTHGDDPQRALAPFRELKSIVGDSFPITEGVAFLEEVESSDVIFDSTIRQVIPSAVGYAKTQRATDFMLASMVCGPEAAASRDQKIRVYNRSKPSLTEKVLGMFGLKSSFAPIGSNPSQSEMIAVEKFFDQNAQGPKAGRTAYNLTTDTWGFNISFRPPRVVGDVGTNLCALQKPQSQDPYFDIHSGRWMIGGVEHKSFLDIVKRHIRADVTGRNLDDVGLPEWWSKNVDTQVKSAVNFLREDFNRIIETKFIPAMVAADKEVKGRQLPMGAGLSVIDSARYNSHLVLRVASAGLAANSPEAERLKAAVNKVMRHYKLSVALFGTDEQTDRALYELETGLDSDKRSAEIPIARERKYGKRVRAAFEKNRELLTKALTELAALVSDEVFAKRFSGSSLQTVTEVRNAALANLGELVTETDSFFGVVNTIRLDLPE